MFIVDFSSWLKSRTSNEEMKIFRVVRVVSRPFGLPMDGPRAKCSLCDTVLCIVVTPQFCITQCLECFPPKECIPQRFQEILRAYYSDRIPLSEPAAAARPLYDVLEMLEPLWPQIAHKAADWSLKFSALLDKLVQHGFCALKPDETNLFNQQEFLWNSNQGAPAHDWVGRVVGYAVAHDQDRDSDIHKSSVALGKRPASALSRPVRRSQVPSFSCMCKRNPRNPAPYLRQTASARLESSPCILGDQPDNEEQSDQPDSQEQRDQPDSQEQSYQPHNWGQSHPRSLLENFFTFGWFRAAPDLWAKAEATVRDSFGEEVHVMNPDLARNLVACLIGAPFLDASRLSRAYMIAAEMSMRRERGTGQMLIPQGLVQQASCAAFWHRLISAFLAVVDPEALPVELLPFEPDETTSDSSSSKRRRMLSIPLESEEMQEMENDGDGSLSRSERGYRFESRRGHLILVVDIRSFEVAVRDIAESRVTSTIGTCYSMRVWGARTLDTGTYGPYLREVHTYAGELDGDESDHHDYAYFEINSDDDDPDSPCSGLGSAADQGGLPSEPAQPSQFDAAGYLDFTKHVDAGPGKFMRFEAEGVATEHHLSNELQKSPFAKVVFRETTDPETTGANRSFKPKWLQRRVPGMRRPRSNLGPTSPSYPVVRMRLQLEEGWGAGGQRMKAVFNRESDNGTLNDILCKRTGAFVISTWSDELPNIQAQEDEDRLLRVQRFIFQEFFGESEYGYGLLCNSGSAGAARVIARSPNRIESVMVLEGTSANSAIVLRITVRFYQFPNGLSNIHFEAHKVHGGHLAETTTFERWGHTVLCVLGEECAKKLTLTLQEIERTQLVGHQIEVDRKIDPAHAEELAEKIYLQEHTVHMALSQILASALPDAKLQLILKESQSLQHADGRRTEVFEYRVDVSSSVTGPDEFILQIRRIMSWRYREKVLCRGRSFSHVNILVNVYQRLMKPIIIGPFAKDIALHRIITDYLDKHCLNCTPAAVLTAIREGGSVTMRAWGRWERLFCANQAAWVMDYCVDVLQFLLRITGQYSEHLILEPPPMGGCIGWDEPVEIMGEIAMCCVDIVATRYFLGPAESRKLELRMEFVKKVVID